MEELDKKRLAREAELKKLAQEVRTPRESYRTALPISTVPFKGPPSSHLLAARG